jgi:hypothetical protein
MLTKPGEEPGWFVARKVWEGEASGVLFVQDVSQCDAEEADAEPGEEWEVVDGMLPDVGLVDACRELKDGRVFCGKKCPDGKP